MPYFTEQELLQIIAAGETDRVEFKESLSGDAATRIREAICSFANDLAGHEEPGLIFVGVKNDGTIGTLVVTDRLLQQLADMKTDGNIVPPPSLTVEKRRLQGKEVAVITVQPSNSPPVRFKGAIHVRIGPRRGIATSQDERILNEKRRHGDRPFDLQPVSFATLSDLNLFQFEHEYLPQAFDHEILEANERRLEERLAAAKMIVSADDPVPTVLGILVLGKRTLDHLPGAYIQFLRLDGNELTDPISDEEAISGTITDVLRRLDEKLNGHNRTAVDFTSRPTERRVSTYPISAIQQIARNAVMHRSYEGNYAPTRVYWYDDRIEILSPGGVFGSVTVDNFGRSGITSYRNPNVAEAMRNLGFVQRYGIGIPLANQLLRQAGHPEMEFNVDMNNVQVTILSCQDDQT